MKKAFALVLILVILLSTLSTAYAERTAPADKSVYETEDQIGALTRYRGADKKFWDAPAEQQGEVVRLDYTTSQYTDEPVAKYAMVYLPYGYNESEESYNIIYFLHGNNETPESFICEERAKNTFDNMIELGLCEPFILVAPTYYYDYESRAYDHAGFLHELREELFPAAESTFRTKAAGTEPQDLIDSRASRALAGYSMGCWTTWLMLPGMMDYCRWFLPFSAFGMIPEMTPLPVNDLVRQGIENYPAAKDDFFIYMACGGARDSSELACQVVSGMVEDTEIFSYGLDPVNNNCFFCLARNEIHQTLIGRHYFYNAFQDVLFKN